MVLQEDIKILSVSVFVNPYTERDEEEEAAKAKEEEDPEDVAARERVGAWYSNPGDALNLTVHKKGVGKYLKPSSQQDHNGSKGLQDKKAAAASAVNIDVTAPDSAVTGKRKRETYGVQFGNFGGW